MVSLSAALSWPRGKSQRSYNTAVLPKNPMFHFLFVFGSFLRFRRRVWFTVAVFGSFLISFLVHFYCQPSSGGSKNEPKMRSKMTQKRPKGATVSTPNYSNQRLCLPVYTIPQQHPRPKWMKYFWIRRTDDELTLAMIQKQRNRILNIHDVYHDDQEIMISSLNQKDTPLGRQEPNTESCSTQRTNHR